jgi:hypothetical protein
LENDEVNKGFKNEAVLAKLEAQVKDFEGKVKEWCGEQVSCSFQ